MTERLIRSLPFMVGDFRFESVIGHGAFSTVFKVRHEFSKNYYAAKAILLDSQTDMGSINVLKAEIDALKSLYHPNVVKIYDILQQFNHFFLIIELCEKGSLFSLIKESRQIPCDQIVSIMRQTLTAISACHAKKISHRDIKPANILIGGDGRCILSDFGLSCNVLRREKVNEFCGSLPYKPPEIIKKITYDPLKGDIWSLGVTFYFIAVGQLPWSHKGVYPMEELIIGGKFRIPSRVPSTIASIISSMIVRDPNMRPSADALLQNSVFKSISPKLVPIEKARHPFLSLSNNMLPFRPRNKSQACLQRLRTLGTIRIIF